MVLPVGGAHHHGRPGPGHPPGAGAGNGGGCRLSTCLGRDGGQQFPHREADIPLVALGGFGVCSFTEDLSLSQGGQGSRGER